MPVDDRKFIFGVDLDGVCADFYGGIRPLAAEWLGVPEASLPIDITYGLTEWGFDRAPGGYPDFHRWAVTERDLFNVLQPIPGSAQTLRAISKMGIHIRIITHRLFVKHFHKAAVAQTVEWLDRHGLPYWDLCFLGEKAHVDADLYIDDAEPNIASLAAAGKKVIVFTCPTNRQLLHQPRANNWAEVEAIVRREFEHWQKAAGGR